MSAPSEREKRGEGTGWESILGKYIPEEKLRTVSYTYVLPDREAEVFLTAAVTAARFTRLVSPYKPEAGKFLKAASARDAVVAYANFIKRGRAQIEVKTSAGKKTIFVSRPVVVDTDIVTKDKVLIVAPSPRVLSLIGLPNVLYYNEVKLGSEAAHTSRAGFKKFLEELGIPPDPVFRGALRSRSSALYGTKRIHSATTREDEPRGGGIMEIGKISIEAPITLHSFQDAIGHLLPNEDDISLHGPQIVRIKFVPHPVEKPDHPQLFEHLERCEPNVRKAIRAYEAAVAANL